MVQKAQAKQKFLLLMLMLTSSTVDFISIISISVTLSPRTDDRRRDLSGVLWEYRKVVLGSTGDILFSVKLCKPPSSSRIG